MPELPEIQALCERMDAFLAGETLVKAIPLQFSALKTVAPSPESLAGARAQSVTRRGKFIIVTFERARILAHLSQGGRVDLEKPAKATRPKGAVVRIAFEDRAVLIKEFGTERKAGWWVVANDDDGPLALLGPEALSDEFARLVESGDDRRRIHTLLRDQRTVAGIGRGFADDILHDALISPFAALMSLDSRQRDALNASVHHVLAAALERERARTGGLAAKLGDRFTVHRRAGLPCPRCGDDLRRVSYDAYEVVYCPPCQTGGRVLADRRMSRLIR